MRTLKKDPITDDREENLEGNFITEDPKKDLITENPKKDSITEGSKENPFTEDPELFLTVPATS